MAPAPTDPEESTQEPVPWISHRGVANRSVGSGKAIPSDFRRQLYRAARKPGYKFIGGDPSLDYTNGDLQHVSSQRLKYYDITMVSDRLYPVAIVSAS